MVNYLLQAHSALSPSLPLLQSLSSTLSSCIPNSMDTSRKDARPGVRAGKESSIQVVTITTHMAMPGKESSIPGVSAWYRVINQVHE